jgi:Rrf2 family iron-sulfur cluster assembly transcriptional regulator
MLRCGKTAQHAISVTSFLAERYDRGETVLSSHDVAEKRNLPQPLVAKILTTLSLAGLVNGTRGPGGGYWLARAPSRISLAHVVENFERDDAEMMCPFGPGWCGSGEPCPLHDDINKFQRDWEEYLRKTTLAVFVKQSAGAG